MPFPLCLPESDRMPLRTCLPESDRVPMCTCLANNARLPLYLCQPLYIRQTMMLQTKYNIIVYSMKCNGCPEALACIKGIASHSSCVPLKYVIQLQSSIMHWPIRVSLPFALQRVTLCNFLANNARLPPFPLCIYQHVYRHQTMMLQTIYNIIV